ncbi:hypothetical protein B2J93_7612 [Marssonina coronariae]|uniref:Uncharacterized protein n=1 Tax=Diplocarpon coronariae TaxID=2795749 RepID=A0A218Z7A7_9HELO|nr:hypothetical protein JHW43_004242 [Diplocarpon mali]OWP03594.1 hypothetical protein B2J93_7612 [Marssonina coronariae]
MPTFLIHGFRWNRVHIRVHIILHDLDDAAPEWIIAPATSVTLLNSFYTLFDFLPPSNPPAAEYPTSLESLADKIVVDDELTGPRTLTKKNKASMGSLRGLVRRPLSLGASSVGKEKEREREKEFPNGDGKGKGSDTDSRATASTNPRKEKQPSFNDWSVVKLLEQYDPEDMETVSQPYAYVADYMVEVLLGVSIKGEIERYEAKVKEEESRLSVPETPTSGTSPRAASNENGVPISPPLSSREIRRRSRRLGWFAKLRDALQDGEEIGWYVVVCGDQERTAPSIVEERGGESVGSEEDEPQKAPRSAGLRGFFGRKKNLPEE